MTRPPRTRPRTGTALAVLAWGLAVFSGCLMLAGRPEVNENLWFYFVDVTVAGVYGTVGAVILARRAHPVGWILALTGVGGGLAALGFAGEVWWSAERMGATPAVVDALNSTAWVPGTLALYVVMPWLVRDHPLGRARWGVAVGGLVVLLATLAAMVGSFPGRGLVIVLSIPVGLVAALAVEQRRRSGPVAERNGLGWLALGTLVMALSFVPLFAPASLGVPVWATPVLHLVAQALFPAAVLVAVLRGRMWGLDLVVSRSTVAALMTFGLLGLYLVAVALLERLLPGEGPAHVLAAGIVALAVQPLRLRLERRVHRLVHGDAVDPSRVVRRLGSRLGEGEAAERLLDELAADLGGSMRLEGVVVLSGDEVLARWGTPRSGHRVPLRHRGRELGALEVTVPAGEALGTRGQRVLAELSPVVAAAVAVTLAARDVEDLRARLSRARAEERRTIRREVHDGLGPSLAGLRLGLQGAHNLVGTDPVAAAALLGSLVAELDERIDAVRELSHHLLPPVLDELGLAAALDELAARYDGSGLAVEVRASALPRLGPELAAAAYAIVAESVANCARHAAASRCRIQVVAAEDLTITVEDDGAGVGADARPGVGTTSMRERAEDLGGHLEIAGAPGGGTSVRAALPLRSGHPSVEAVGG